MSYRPNRRDPLTLRVARTLSETRRDAYEWWEDSAEPQRLVVEQPDPADRLLVRWGPLCIVVVVVLILLRWI